MPIVYNIHIYRERERKSVKAIYLYGRKVNETRECEKTHLKKYIYIYI